MNQDLKNKKCYTSHFPLLKKKRKNNYKKVKNDIFEQEENQLNKLSRIDKVN